MKTSKYNRIITIMPAVTILIIIVLIKVVTFYPDWIEKNYSGGLYPYISSFYRTVFGWLPFSLGDLLYATAGAYLLVKLIKFIKILTKGRLKQTNVKKALMKAFYILSAVYIYFNLSWGLNYNRPGIAYQLQLNPEMHNEQDLRVITGILLKKVNENRLKLNSARIKYKPYSAVFNEAQAAYKTSAIPFPFLDYKYGSIKRSMYGRLGNFLGFLGYYNPFTGEAQLNLTMPRFLIPYVTCHEMAHQVGYASESEANFVGYLAAMGSNETLFHYSTYFDLFNYANYELSRTDSIAARNNYKQLDTLVKKDAAELKEYWRKSNNVIEPIIKVFYDHYLKANQQSQGMKSYNQVIGWLIGYYKKYGKI